MSQTTAGLNEAGIKFRFFPRILKRSIDLASYTIVMHNCPRQNFKIALKVLQDVGDMLFQIPAHLPDLNSIIIDKTTYSIEKTVKIVCMF